MAGVESYNPERRNTNMAEGTPGPGAEGASPQGETTPAAGAPKVAEGQFPPRPAWQIYNGFDRGKLEKDEYEFRIENPDSPYTLIVDPSSIDPDTKKPKVVAKILTIAGGAWGLFGRRQDQPQSGQDQQGNQGVPGPGQPETQAEIQGDVPEPTTAVNQTAAEGEAAVSPVPESPEKPPEQVAEDGGGGDNGERNGGQEPPPGQPPEGPRGPEPPRGPEWETSPERGRWLVEQIVYMETKLPYEVRYNAENGPKLNEYYAKLEQFVERTQEDRHKEKAFDPVEEHQVKPEEGEELLQAIQRTYDEWLKDGVKGREEAQPPENLSKLAPLRELITNFDNAYFPSPTVSEADRAKAIAERTNTVAELLKYFREADRRGILVGVNMILDSIYENIVSGKREQEEVRALADQQTVKSAQNERPSAYNSAEYSFASRLMGDPDVERLFNVWDPFLKLARMRLESEINQQEWIPLEGEWRPTSWGSGEEETTETFWSPYGGYPDYYIVSARTPAQFRRAMESFIEIIRNGSLGYAPADLFQNIQNFQRVFSARASLMAREHEAKAKSEQRPIGPDDMTLDISIEDRQELQGRAYLWYSYYQYEHYNKEEAKSGATAMALNEGPARHTAVLRSGAEGEVGSGTWDYDYLRAIELALNAQGSRGQLGNYTPAQEYLRDTIFKMQVEKRMGVVLKDYDRRDIASSTDFTARKKRDERLEAIDRYLRRHRGNLNTLSEEDRDYYLHQKAHASRNRYHIGIHQSAEEMRSLYEGFDHGDAHRRVYQEFKGLPPEELKKLPRKLLKSFRLGMVQSMMDQVRGEIRKGIRIDRQDHPVKAVFRKSDDLLEITINRLVEEGQIEEKEKGLYRRIYQDAYARAKASFEVTQQLEGVSHETTVRGGGVYFIYRNRAVVNYVREYINFRQEHQKKVKASDSDTIKEISKWSLEQRKANFTHDQHLGWIIDEMAKGRKLDTFPPAEQALYNTLNIDERETFVDNVPIHQAQEYGMAAVNCIMMQYSDDSPIWQTLDLERIIVATKEGSDQYLYPNFRAIYRTAVLNHTLDTVLNEFTTNGFSAKLHYYEYDYDLSSFDPKKGEIKLTPKGEPKVMTFKKPHVFGYTELGQPIIAFGQDGQPILGYDEDGQPIRLSKLDIDTNTKQPIIYDKATDEINQEGEIIPRRRISLDISDNYHSKKDYRNDETCTLVKRIDGHGRISYVAVDEVELDFQTAVDSYLALHTTHTYWAYQSNNTHTLIPEYVFEQARQIRDGLLRPEDADIFAGLLLTLDPTLSRVKSFSGDKMAVEGIVFDAAVEQSLMGSVYVKSKLNEKIMPRDGNAEFMGMGYFTEDLGGDMGFAMEAAARAAKMPKRWVRRFAAVLSSAPIYIDSMARNVGRRGVTGATTLMADNIKDLTHQPIMSQFSLTKFINMLDSSSALWFALVGGTDPKTGIHHEGLFMKPTNNADKLAQLRDELPWITQLPNKENVAFYAFLDSFGRAWDTLKVIRTMYSDVRNAGGALLLERKDVFLPNGRINPEITLESERNTGTSRHIARMFWNTFVNWLTDEGPGGGQQAYKDVAYIYKFLNQPFFEEKIVQKGERYLDYEDYGKEKVAQKTQKYLVRDGSRTWADWIFDKMAL